MPRRPPTRGRAPGWPTQAPPNRRPARTGAPPASGARVPATRWGGRSLRPARSRHPAGPRRPAPGSRRPGPPATYRPGSPQGRPRPRPDLRTGSRLGGGAGRLLPPCHKVEHLLTALPPRFELVRLVSVAPRLLGSVRVAREPLGPAQLVPRFDHVRPELQRLLEEDLRILEHLPLEVDEAQVVVGVQRGLLVVVEADGLREVLDGLAEDPLLEADVTDVDP